MYRYISHESCSQFDSLPLTYLTSSLLAAPGTRGYQYGEREQQRRRAAARTLPPPRCEALQPTLGAARCGGGCGAPHRKRRTAATGDANGAAGDTAQSRRAAEDSTRARGHALHRRCRAFRAHDVASARASNGMRRRAAVAPVRGHQWHSVAYDNGILRPLESTTVL